MIAGNWKMHGDPAFAAAYAAELAGTLPVPAVDVLLLPPAPVLPVLADALGGTDVMLGVQNVHAEASGAYTGELAAEMARGLGATWTLAGHSERRASCGETDANVAAKVAAAFRAGLNPIVCVGETLAERQAGSAEAVVCRQLDAIAAAEGRMGSITVAYEPVWAIGTGHSASPEEAQAMHAVIRARLARHCGDAAADVRILYGGSVKPDNAPALLAGEDIDGALVGGASLKVASFAALIAAAAAAEDGD
jgi:triosephosphate isomerase